MDDINKIEAQLIEELAALRQRVTELEEENAQKTRYQHMFEHHPAIMLLIDPETGDIVDANPAACAFYGYPRQTLVTMNIKGINILPEAQIQAEMNRARTEQRHYFVFPHRLASNEVRTVEVRTNPILIGGKTLLYSIIHDITKRLENERALRISEARYRLLVSHIPDSAVMLCDRDLRFILVGGAEIERISDIKEKMEGRILQEVIPAPYAGIFEQNVHVALAGVQFEAELPWIDNTWYRHIYIPLADEANNTDMVMILVQNITAQKRMMERAQLNEDRYRILSELASDYAYAYQVTPEGDFLLEWITEDSLTRITGYTTDDFDQTMSLYVPADLPRYRQDMEKLMAGQQTENEYRIFTKSGELRWLLLSRYPVWDKEEECVVRFYGIAKDITLRKQAEEALRQSELRHRMIAEMISDYAFSFHLDPDNDVWVFEWVSGGAAYTRITGYEVSEISHTLDTNLSIYYPEDRDRAARDIERIVAGETFGSDYRFVRKNGGLCWVHIERRPVWDEAGKRVTRFYGTVKDVTAQKQAEEALRESEQRHRMISEMISDFTFYYRVNPDHSITYEWGAQDVLYELSNYQPAEIPEIIKLFHPADRELAIQHHQQMLTGKTASGEYRIVTKSGELRWIHIHRHPVWDDVEKRVIGFYGVTRDITQNKQAEETRLAFALERERVDILSNFITHVSHEFRTPLAVIQTSTHLLKRVSDPEHQQRQVTIIEQQVHHINKLVDNLITLSGLDNIRKLPGREVDLAELLYTVNDTMQVAQQEKDLTVVFDLTEDHLLAWGDASYLMQALQRIWENAIQHSPVKGTLTIGLDRQDEQAVITITDIGTGISAEDLPRIFNRFFRTDRAGTERGFGLGLPIAKAIVDLHHGRIDVDSEPGKGSTFSILLPLA